MSAPVSLHAHRQRIVVARAATRLLLAYGLGYAAGGRTLLGPLSLELEQGRRHIVLGPNGAGKSLLLRLLHGLIQPTAGSFAWVGTEAGAPPPSQAFVFQKPVMLRRSVRADLDLALAARGVAAELRPARIEEALDAVGLAHLAARPARLLSGGEQQRVALARAWALRPAVLFLDEPTASLDPAACRVIEATVTELHRQGVTIVMTTHDLGQARRMADQVLFLHHGLLLEVAPAEQFFVAARTAEARRFLAGELLE